MGYPWKVEISQNLMSFKSKELAWTAGAGEKKRGGEKMKESLAMLLKTHGEKMTENRPLAMLMKTNGLKSLSGDVDENKGEISRTRGQ
jgi:hypothetical protein